MENIVINSSKAMNDLLKILGLDNKRVIAFDLHCECDKMPTIIVKMYIPKRPRLPENIMTQRFELIAIDN